MTCLHHQLPEEKYQCVIAKLPIPYLPISESKNLQSLCPNAVPNEVMSKLASV